MSFKYTRTTLEKLVKLFEEMQYKVRFEKGNFQSGYCLVESKKIVVVNKFFEVKGRISVLLDILSQISVDYKILSPESLELLEHFGLLLYSEEAA